MDERSANAVYVAAHVMFLAYLGLIVWFVYRRLCPPAQPLARVLHLVRDGEDVPLCEGGGHRHEPAAADPASEPPKPKGKKGH